MKRTPTHSKEELKQKQAMSLESKIQMSKIRIREWYNYWGGDVYVSFSGGKDSTVLMHLVKSIYPDVPIVFIDTGLEYPEIKDFAKQYSDIILKPEKSFPQVISEYGYPIISKEVSQVIQNAKVYLQDINDNEREKPRYSYCYRRLMGIGEYENSKDSTTKYSKSNRSGYSLKKYGYLLSAPFKISNKCCDIMKKYPAKTYEKKSGRHPYIGTMAEESIIRTQGWMYTGCNAFNAQRPHSMPLSFWTEQDILEYIKSNNIEICSIYGDIINTNGKFLTTGVNRTGCMFCMFGIHLEKEPNRFQKMKQTHPQIYEYCINKLQCGKVLDFIGVDY